MELSDEKARRKAEKKKLKALKAAAGGDEATEKKAKKARKAAAAAEATASASASASEEDDAKNAKKKKSKEEKKAEKGDKKVKKKKKKDKDGEEDAAAMEEAEVPRKRPRTRSMDAAEGSSSSLDFFASSSSSSSAASLTPPSSPKKAKKLQQKAAGASGLPAARDASMGDAAEGASLETPAEFKAAHSITILGFDGVGGEQEPAPVMRFKDVPFPKLAAPLAAAGFTAPSPIQALAWPIACGAPPRDLIAVAKTGSGKTLGFLLPAFKHLADARPYPNRGDPPKVLCLAPTRELAVQIHDEAVKFGKGSCGVRSVVCFGGAPKSQQIRQLQAGADVLVATPGRLNDLLEMRRADVSQVSFLVFDEADRMLDMGFEPQIREVLKHVPPHGAGSRQTMFFTATWPKKVQALAATFLHKPVQVNIGSTTQLTASKSITQHVHVVESQQKWPLLEKTLAEVPKDSKILVFSATKRGCNEVADELWKKGVAVDCIHGDKQQWERTRVLESFKRGSVSVLVATDVAARGLDVPNVSHVINYDFPAGTDAVEDYVHRIGRTGRGNNVGEAITFFTRKDGKAARELEGIMKQAGQFVPPELAAMAQKAGWGGGKGGGWGGGRGGGRGGFRGGGRGGKGGGGFRGGKGKGGGGFHQKW